MPLPSPKDSEDQKTFIQRCASDDAMKKEFKDNDQRLAVCYKQWRDNKPKRQALEGPMLTRAASMGSDAILDDEARRIRVSFSSEAPVLRTSFFDEPWVEVLGHGAEEIDLSRFNSGGAPLLYNHDTRRREHHIGVIERAWLEDGRGYADIRFSKRPEVQSIWEDVRSGILTGVSVGYQIQERILTKEAEAGAAEYRVTKWLPLELSSTPLPADFSVGFGRTATDPPPLPYHRPRGPPYGTRHPNP